MKKYLLKEYEMEIMEGTIEGVMQYFAPETGKELEELFESSLDLEKTKADYEEYCREFEYAVKSDDEWTANEFIKNFVNDVDGIHCHDYVIVED